MSRHTAGHSGARRRKGRIALASALVLAAEAALISGQTAIAAPDEPTAPAATTSANSPSPQEIWESDLAWAAQHTKGSIAWALAEAKKTGKKTVVTDETTPTTYTVANPDGTLTTELTAGPERVWKNGTWQKADATLTEAADGTVAPKAHPNGLRLGGKSGVRPKSLRAAQDETARDLVTLGSGESQVTLRWKGGLPKPELDGTRARYKNAVPGADVVVEATRTGFEQFVELHERPTGAYTYTLPVKAKGLKAEANNDGSVTFTDAETGAERATMPAPVMWDASVDERSGEHTRRARVDMKVVDKGDGELDLVVTPSAAFLADPATRYPVTVDPSTSALSNTFDTYVQQGETVDWSNDTELDLGNPGTKNPDGTPRTARSFISWNTTPIQDALIVDTNLALWNFHSGNTDCAAQSWTVWDTSAPSTSSRWTAQPTWNQQYHSSTETKGSPDCAAQPDGWINADVDTLVQSWASAKATRGHMGLRAATDDVKAWKRVNSANNAANQPKLTVTYNYRPSDGTNRQAGAPFRSYAGVWAVNSTTPTLRDTFTDPDGDQVNGTFQVYDAATDTPITTPSGEGLLVSGFVDSGKPASVTVPAGQLQDGRTYKFRTNAYDGSHYNLSWSPWTQFVVDTTAPGAPQSVTSATYPENWGGGGAGVKGDFAVTTGAPDAYEVRYRLDPYSDDADDAGWASVNTTSGTAAAAKAVAAPAAPAAPDASYAVTPAADGNHVAQTLTVDRAGNVGPIRDYGFTAGSRDYNRAQKIDIKLPANDSSSQQPDPTDPPKPALDGWKQGGSAARTFTTGDDTQVTITPKAQASKAFTQKAAQELRLRAGTRPAPIVKDAWCQPDLFGEAQKSLMTRTQACLFFDLSFTAESKLEDGVVPVKYQAEFEVHFQVKTDAHGDAIKTWVQINPVLNNFPGNERAVVMGAGNPGAWFDSMCVSDGCNTGGDSARQNIDFYGDLTWKGGMNGNNPVDAHMATGTADHKWNGAVDSAAGTTDDAQSKSMAVSFNARPVTEVEPPPGLNGKKGEWRDDYASWQSPLLVVTCDKVASYGAPGCVLPQYAPTYVFNTAAYPEAAAHAWLIQNKSKVKGLGQSWDAPLQYLPPAARNKHGYDSQKSRDAMCTRYKGPKSGGTGWVPRKTFLPHPKTALHHAGPHFDEVNCDEFPFASTYQSAGMKAVDGGKNEAPGGGADCMQTVSATADDGSVHFLDDTRYDAPTFNENCGRSSMSGDVNQGSMRPFGDFARQMRLLDEQAYFLDPGNAWFKGCETSKAELICTMTKP
ncbi:DNRLRE domain-containing protein [Streptomyces sp. NPDC058579]|uniref:DNRLRE domain-containing protein n=1 Tax=Streptomyces sp. NPDC058579 TaxID=3346548 RepID=UPI00364C3AA8